MRRVIDIVCAVHDQTPVTDQEIRLAILCLASWGGMVWRKANRAAAEHPEGRKSALDWIARGYWTMKAADPEVYLGPRCTPGTPEFIEAQRLAKKIFKKATGKDLDEL